MDMALDLAVQGRGYTSPNPLVGAVVVNNGVVAGKGFHEAVGQNHAEVNALNHADDRADGATLYVTLEPCNHFGRTPPCTQRIVESGIKRVVVAMKDPNPDVKGGGNDYLRSHGIEVTEGVGEKRACKINEAFIKYTQTQRPFVILKCAATLDGRIAARTGDAKWITGERSREYVHHLRHATDAIMVGIGTVKADNPSLTTRLEGVRAKDPLRIILDTKLAIDTNAKVFQLESEASTILITGDSVSAEKKKRIEQKGAKVISVALKDERIDLNALMGRLGAMGVTSLLIEGGSRVIASAMSAGVVDKINFFFAPKISGGDDGIPICKGPGPDLIGDCIRLDNITTRQFNNDVMIEGYIKK
jgi:diaminohydroxyphosphoribosylaminopyrimidine deaminase/5-amino-6-(5-phosphoribosylamino)uracil reductase